jgi:hypothetical protein
LLAAAPAAWGVLYFSPATAAVLAGASGPGGFSSDILDHFGLGTGSRVTAQNASATSSGYTVHLVGVYSDSIRTVILLNTTPPAYAGISRMQLTDQFGTIYQPRNGEGHLDTGDQAYTFDPPSQLALVTGMRLTLRFNEVGLLDGKSVPGTWMVKGVVLPQSGTILKTPAAGSLGSGTVTFVEARYSGRVVSIRADVRGVSLDGVVPAPGPAAKPHPRFSIELKPADGSAAKVTQALGWSSTGGVTHFQAIFINVDPGTYRLTFTLEGAGTLTRTLVVPE